MSDLEVQQRNWSSVRVVLEGLILAALLWSAKSQVTLQTQIAVLQDNVLAMRSQLADVPGLADRVSRLEVQVDRDRADINEVRGHVLR